MVDWSSIDTVLLDMDGTLLDLSFDNYFWLEYLPEKVAAQRDIEITEAFHTVRTLSDETYGSLLWYCLDHWSEQLSLDVEALKKEVGDPEKFIQELHKQKSENYRALLKSDGIQFRPGIVRIINEARENKIQLGVATSSSMANLTTLFNKIMNIEPNELFNSIVTSDTVQEKKPSPAAYQCVLAGLRWIVAGHVAREIGQVDRPFGGGVELAVRNDQVVATIL